MLASMGIVARSFEEPDELVTSPLVEVQVVVLGEVYVARTVHQPGWSWSEHMQHLQLLDVRPPAAELCSATPDSATTKP